MSAEPAPATVPSLKIVVVEDDPTIRQFLRESLEKIGHLVVGEAATGTDMVRMVLSLSPDLVVFDIHLPHLDGIKALGQIYQEKVVAAVAITADRDQDLVRRAIEEHVLAYLIKPVEEFQLAPAIQVAWARFEEMRNLSNEKQTLQQNLESRKVIERAKGVLMKRHHWTEEAAFKRLQRGAMNRRMPMRDLAQAVLNGKHVDL